VCASYFVERVAWRQEKHATQRSLLSATTKSKGGLLLFEKIYRPWLIEDSLNTNIKCFSCLRAHLKVSSGS
jgi:hypothetical protein